MNPEGDPILNLGASLKIMDLTASCNSKDRTICLMLIAMPFLLLVTFGCFLYFIREVKREIKKEIRETSSINIERECYVRNMRRFR